MWQQLRVYGIPQGIQYKMFCDLAFMKIKRLKTVENKIFKLSRGDTNLSNGRRPFEVWR